MAEIRQKLRDRDLKIIHLESKVMELDRKIIDLQVSVTGSGLTGHDLAL